MLVRIQIVLLVCLCAACAPASRQDIAAESGFDVIELSIEQAQQAMRTGLVSCQQLTRIYLKRIKAYDQPSRLNAITTINPKAMQRSRQLDRKFAGSGRMKTLHCMPVILKDNFDSVELPTEAGSIVLQGSHPPDDAFMVQRLRQHDAIIIARSNMGEDRKSVV